MAHIVEILTNTSKETFEIALERVRRSFALCMMPEQVHLLIGEPQPLLLLS